MADDDLEQRVAHIERMLGLEAGPKEVQRQRSCGSSQLRRTAAMELEQRVQRLEDEVAAQLAAAIIESVEGIAP